MKDTSALTGDVIQSSHILSTGSYLRLTVDLQALLDEAYRRIQAQAQQAKAEAQQANAEAREAKAEACKAKADVEQAKAEAQATTVRAKSLAGIERH